MPSLFEPFRFQGYNHFGDHPELMLEWFATHMA